MSSVGKLSLKGFVISLISALASTAANAQDCTPPPAGLISWWSGDGASGDLVGTNHGTLIGNTSYRSAIVNQGFLLDGTDDIVRVGNSPSLRLQNFTIEAWVKRNSLTMVSTGDLGNGHIFGYGEGGYVFLYQQDGVVVLNKVGDFRASFSPFTVTDTNWHHVAVTKTNSTVVFYLDGTAHTGNAFDPGFVFNTEAAIGGRADNLGNSFMGTIDEVSIYNRALSTGEIQLIYNASNAGKCAGSPSAPVIITQPLSQSIWLGGNATFSAATAGSTPFSFQWRFNGTAIPGATTSHFTKTNAQLSDGGNYSVVVSNSGGSVTSDNATLVVLPPGSCAPPGNGLVGWWPGEENSSDAAGANDGIPIGDTTYAPAVVGHGFLFDGTEDIVSVGNPTSLQLQNFTIEAWVKRNSLTMVSTGDLGNGHIFGYGDGGYVFLYQQNGVLVLNKVGDFRASFSPFTVTDTNWHHVAVTKTNSTVVFYLDGIAYSGNAFDPGFVFNTEAAIGGRADNNGNSFMGIIDEVSVYNRALEPSEIQSIYNASAVGKCRPSNDASPCDFNSDGKVDLVWQNNSGIIAVWLMNGTGFIRSVPLNSSSVVTRGWHVVGQADFNGDTNIDLAMQHDDGRVAIWLMDGTNIVAPIIVRTVASAWKVTALGDFNRDTLPDLVWRHNDGRIAVWLMSGTNFVSAKMLNNGQPVNPAWRIVAGADFNHDGQTDLIWEHIDGWLVVSFMNGSDFVRSFYLDPNKPLAIGWHLAGVADFNGDGWKDLLLQSDKGPMAVWEMIATSHIRSRSLHNGPPSSSAWHMVGPR